MSLVRDVLAQKGTDVCKIDQKKTVLDAATIMNERRIGAVMVMNGDKIAGIFTERDVLNRVVAKRKDPAATKIQDVMTTKIACCEQDTTLESCRAVMTKNKIRHLPVVEGGKLVGVISSGDILAREIQDQEETIRYLHEYMHGPN
ncbi:MAG: CBS domain-containing protein [Phycisphaerales bacterium]|nr:CBS domain-containing protein [Phycisphaerales bacterium]